MGRASALPVVPGPRASRYDPPVHGHDSVRSTDHGGATPRWRGSVWRRGERPMERAGGASRWGDHRTGAARHGAGAGHRARAVALGDNGVRGPGAARSGRHRRRGAASGPHHVPGHRHGPTGRRAQRAHRGGGLRRGASGVRVHRCHVPRCAPTRGVPVVSRSSARGCDGVCGRVVLGSSGITTGRGPRTVGAVGAVHLRARVLVPVRRPARGRPRGMGPSGPGGVVRHDARRGGRAHGAAPAPVVRAERGSHRAHPGSAPRRRGFSPTTAPATPATGTRRWRWNCGIQGAASSPTPPR